MCAINVTLGPQIFMTFFAKFIEIDENCAILISRTQVELLGKEV
jgi:hypothetical protein